MPCLGRIRNHMHVVARHVLEKGDQVYFLLIIGAKTHACLLADDCHGRHVVLFRIVKPVKDVDRAQALM